MTAQPILRTFSSEPAAPKPRLLDQVRNAWRVRHYSLRTEDAYAGWVRRFILFHNKRHPKDMGAPGGTKGDILLYGHA